MRSSAEPSAGGGARSWPRLAPACLPAPRRAVLRVWFCDDAVATVAAADAAEARARSPAESAFLGRTRAAPGPGATRRCRKEAASPATGPPSAPSSPPSCRWLDSPAAGPPCQSAGPLNGGLSPPSSAPSPAAAAAAVRGAGGTPLRSRSSRTRDDMERGGRAGPARVPPPTSRASSAHATRCTPRRAPRSIVPALHLRTP